MPSKSRVILEQTLTYPYENFKPLEPSKSSAEQVRPRSIKTGLKLDRFPRALLIQNNYTESDLQQTLMKFIDL